MTDQLLGAMRSEDEARGPLSARACRKNSYMRIRVVPIRVIAWPSYDEALTSSLLARGFPASPLRALAFFFSASGGILARLSGRFPLLWLGDLADSAPGHNSRHDTTQARLLARRSAFPAPFDRIGESINVRVPTRSGAVWQVVALITRVASADLAPQPVCSLSNRIIHIAASGCVGFGWPT